MKHNFNFKTLLLAIGLVVASVQPAWAATERYIYCGISNEYQNNKDSNNWGFNFWGGASGGVKSPTWIQDNYSWDNRNYTIYRVEVYDDNNKAQFKGNNDWWDPGDGYGVTLNGTTKNAVFFSHDKDGWSGQFQENYQETSTGSLSAGSSTTTVGTQVTLTPALTSKSDVNEIKSTAYSVTTNPGSAGSVSNGKFSATAAGTYVIKATITYNPKGFTGITKTVDATTTITVEANYTVSLVANPSAFGNVSVSSVQAGSIGKASISATANACYSFVNWTGTTGISFDDANSASTKVAATQAGTATANFSERFYLRGSLKDNSGNEGMPGWGNDAPFVYANSEFAVTRTLSAGKVYKFMIFDKTADKQKGCTDNSGNSVIPWNTAWTCNGDYQICFTANVNGDYKFVVTQDGDNPRIKVIPPSQTIDLYKDGNKIRTISATFGEAFNKNVLTLPDDTAKTGYSFKGFYTATSGGTGVISKVSTGFRYTANDTYGTKSSPYSWCYTETTLNAYAQYSANKYNITLLGGGGEGDSNGSANVTYNVSSATGLKDIVEPTKVGYHIRDNAYYTDNTYTQKVANKTGSLFNGTVEGYLTDGKWTRAENTTLYTYFEPNQYTLTLDDNNGTSTTSTKTVTYDANTNLTQKVTIPAKTGQDFTGYWTNNDGTGTQLVGSDGKFLDEVPGYIKATKLWGYADNLTIYAGWANHAYTITYKDQGDKTFSGNWGATEHPTTHTYNTTTTLVDAPNKTGYTFGGWYSEATCENKVTELGATAYTANITLYAKWIPTTTTITLYRNDETDATTTHVATYDGAVTSITNLTDAVRTRTGYSHDGIYAAATGGSYIIKYNNGWTYNSTTSEYATSTQWKYTGTTLGLYSQWTAKKYAITLSDNGGTGGSGTTQVTFDAKPASVNVPTKVVSEIAQIFTGYYYNDVQIFNNSGAIVLNAGGGTYTDNSGNWKYDGELELTAKWEAPAKQVVHFGVTNGTTADETSGTISAKIKDTETVVTSGSELDAGTIITITFAPKDGQYISGNKGWKLASWYAGVNTSTADKLADAGNSNSYDYTIPTKTSYVYAYAPEVTNTFAIVVNSEQTRMGSVDPAQGTAGPNVMQQITATPNDGYSFVNWTQTSDNYFAFVEGTSATDATAKVALKNQSGQTITANFQIHNYTITYNGLEGGTHSNPATYTIETATITLQDASRDDYTFDGWYDAETEGNKVTEIVLGSTGDKTLWARWHETMHSVNIVESTGIESVSPSGATNVGNVTPVTITAIVEEGYTWDKWTSNYPSHITGDLSQNPTSIKVNQSLNVTANATENMTTITINANQTTWGKLQIGSGSTQNWGDTRKAGVATTHNLTAKPNTGYKFVNWTLTGGATSTSTLTNATITIKGNGVANSTGTATAIFEEDLSSNWYLAGTDNIFPNGWNTGETNMMKRATGHSTENVYYFTIHVDDEDIKPSGQESTYQFKIRHYKEGDGSCDDYFGWSTGDTHYWVNKTCSTGVYKGTGNDNNLYFIPTSAGDYEFKVDATGTDPQLTVTFPAAQTYTVTISADANGTVEPSGEQQIDAYNGISVTATPNPGYHFDSWVASDGITTTSNTATTTVKATKAGTLQATFAANTPIYFQNTMQDAWGTDSMFVYFYKNSDYWDSDKGTGSDKSKHSASCIAGPCKMTRISNTNIWEYAYDPTTVTGIVGVVFADRRMKDYEYFTQCNATRRMDFGSGCANMFVLQPGQTPEDKNTSNGNTVHYYGAGFWRGYNMLSSKMSLHVWDVSTSAEVVGGNVEMMTDVPGNEAFTAKVNLASNHQYNIYLGSCVGANFSQEVTITSENYSGFDLYQYNSIDDKSHLASLHTAAGGDYVFTLTFDDAHMLLSVEYPIMQKDYRVKIDTPTRYSNIIRNDQESGTISMYLAEGDNTFKYEYASDVDHTPITWTENETINVNVEKAGVYTMTLHKNKTIDNVKPYTGNYYVRTDCAQGGWNEYKTNDNNLMRFTDRNPKYVNDSTTGFNYYYCRWNANENGNVRFVVANEINACISDTMKADKWLDNNEALKGMANIRFGWNSNTNALSRAYISGSFDSEEYIRILSGDSKLFEYPKADEGSYTEITAKKFKDENDWTYTMDVYADGGSKIAVSAKYNNKYQFFVGTGDASTGAISDTVQLLKGGTKQHLHLVYDFKTDRLVSGWVPGGNITDTVILDADMLLARIGQSSADQINITTAGVQIQDIKTIYAVLQLDREKMLSDTAGIKVEGHKYENAIYWFSLPFDVKVNDIFGVDGYGTKWVLQYYDGAKRAKIGFFAETETFWTYLGINDTIKANVGYAVCLDPDYFDSAEDEIWANNRQSVCFYFPSTDKNHKIVGKDSITISVPAHKCTIDREFGDADENGKRKNHKDTDSHWNVIGSPAFQDMEGTAEMKINSLYKWNPTDNTYEVEPVEGFTFKSTSAYLVQFCGDIKWKDASVIINAAPRYTYADEKNYTIELQFYYGSQWDRTYIALKDNAQEDFVLNEDLTKMTNSGQPNIYSFAGAYDVAYNGTAFKDQIVNLGVIARKNGSYTFAMPKDFSGSAILVDLESGEATDLNLSNYTVELNKGTYNNRFQLILKVEASTPTNIDNVDSREWSVDGKTKKLLINDQIYLINGGRVYNVLGAELR